MLPEKAKMLKKSLESFALMYMKLNNLEYETLTWIGCWGI